MKAIMKVTPIFALFILVVSCATTPHILPEKYNLDDSLKAVRQISVFKISDYENVDNQSIILETDRNNYYLLVLSKPIEIKYSNLSLDISSTVSKDREISTQTRLGAKATSKGVPSTEFRQGPSKIVTIASGYDKIAVQDDVAKELFVIAKIYKLNGREQAEEFKKRLRVN